MATEILVNDGGAPARILPFTAGEALAAGDAVGCTHVGSGDVTVNKLDSADTSVHFLGVALTDCDSGAMANVITGRGVICRINCADVNGGRGLMAGTTDGQLIQVTNSADGTALSEYTVAISLEDGALSGGGAGLVKCLLVG